MNKSNTVKSESIWDAISSVGLEGPGAENILSERFSPDPKLEGAVPSGEEAPRTGSQL